MNQRLISVLAFAFIVSAGASLLLYRLLSNRGAPSPAPKSVKLILAARDLEPGTLVRETDIRFGDWTGAVPEGALQKKEDIVGRGVISPILTPNRWWRAVWPPKAAARPGGPDPQRDARRGHTGE